MGRRRLTLAVGILVLAGLGLLVWAPWLSSEEAEARVAGEFTSAWQGVADGCGFNCRGCGATNVRRLVLGYSVRIEYACGLLPADTSEYHRTEAIYVSPLGTVHGLERP